MSCQLGWSMQFASTLKRFNIWLWEVQVVVMAHSWGDNVFRNFLHWMEQEDRGWADKYIHAYANIGGPVLGVPKSIGSLLSGTPRGPVMQELRPRS